MTNYVPSYGILSGVSTLLVEQNYHPALQVADYDYVLETGDVRIHSDSSSTHNAKVVETYSARVLAHI
jgi:ABC-type branched-subunit amino acid transport system ATPase component